MGEAVGAASAPPTVAVVVPAHDEEHRVEACLQALLRSEGVRLRVVVVPNGCTDATAARARAVVHEGLTVHERERPGKAGAILEGLRLLEAEEEATGSGAAATAVVDADVELSVDALAHLASALAGPQPRLASVQLDLDTAGCSWAARRYARTWLRRSADLVTNTTGRGVYAVNRAGLERLRRMPEDVTADDGWARASFAPSDRVLTEGRSRVRAARTLREQARRRARIRATSAELDALFPDRVAQRAAPERTPAAAGRRLRGDGLSDTALWYLVDTWAGVLARRGSSPGGAWVPDASTRR